MTSVLAPVKNITLQGIAPDVIQSCVLAPPPPTPAPEPEDVIYAPVAPGITYGSLPAITTGTTPGNLVIVDTSPDQIIGCANDVGTDPQSRLNALFPSAVDGDGVVDRATNNIWVYDGATWNNVGPTPGPTLTVNSTIPPWNEIVVYDARVRTRLEVNGLAYALQLLTTVPAIGTLLGLAVQSYRALIRVPAAATVTQGRTPRQVSSVPSVSTQLAALAPGVSTSVSVNVPATSLALNAISGFVVGPQITTISVPVADTLCDGHEPSVSAGASVLQPSFNINLAAAAPFSGQSTVSNTWSSAGTTATLNQRVGFKFTVGASDIAVHKIAVYGAAAAAERVIIHRVSDGVAVATQDINSAVDSWVEVGISSVVLGAGVEYVISMRRTNGSNRSVYRNPGSLAYASDIGSVSYVSGTSDALPTSSTSNAYAMVRFSYVVA
jgi:hypothetical protein